MSRLDTRALARFLAVTCGFSWSLYFAVYLLPALPALARQGLVTLSMFGPALGTLVATRGEPGRVRSTGLGLGTRWPRFWALAWFGTPALIFGALALSSLLGTFDADVAGLSGFAALLQQSGKALPAWATPQRLVLLQLGAGVMLAPVLNALPAFGEEWGWRGWLLPRLLPLGTWRALVLHGLVWGLWHAPIVLQGHNYPRTPVAGVLYMVVMCVLLGTLMGWTRLATGSVWPSVIMHGSLNGLAGAMLLLQRSGTELAPERVGVLGWPGWLLMAALVGLLVWLRQLPGRRAPRAGAHAAGTAAP